MFILVFIIVFGDLLYETTAVCPAGSFTNSESGICYWYKTAMTAAACNASCASEGGTVGEIPDQKSQVFLMQYFNSLGSITGGIWVGVNDIDAELHFSTWDGYPQSYFNWMAGQPNGYPLYPATEQDCIAMFTAYNYTWQDKPCSESHRCLCSYRSSSRCFCNGGMSALTQEQFDEILKDLQVDKDSTNAAKRKLISAKDDRPSAQTIGYIGIIIIGVTYSLPILLDVQRLCQKKKIADA